MKKWGIIGTVCFIAAVAVGYFVNFPADYAVKIALAAFGLAGVILSAFKDAKEKKIPEGVSITVICLALIGGAMCAIGGYTESVFSEIAGVVVLLLGLILGIVAENKK